MFTPHQELRAGGGADLLSLPCQVPLQFGPPRAPYVYRRRHLTGLPVPMFYLFRLRTYPQHARCTVGMPSSLRGVFAGGIFLCDFTFPLRLPYFSPVLPPASPPGTPLQHDQNLDPASPVLSFLCPPGPPQVLSLAELEADRHLREAFVRYAAISSRHADFFPIFPPVSAAPLHQTILPPELRDQSFLAFSVESRVSASKPSRRSVFWCTVGTSSPSSTRPPQAGFFPPSLEPHNRIFCGPE
jgi:hypothetical protein